MKKLIFLLCLLPTCLWAQTQISWNTLEEVMYKGKVNAMRFQGDYDPPQFSETLLALDGQEVILKGFMLPLTVDRKDYILSKYPFTECYFCGNGTKESVVEVILESPAKKYPYDDQVTIRGTLTLNTDPYLLTYTLKDAAQIK